MDHAQSRLDHPQRGLVLAALGVVFGDIGTSPLYALRECFTGHHGLQPTSDSILGVLSMVTWTLMLIISLKYMLLVLRADNRGEGGVLALMALIKPYFRHGGRRWRCVIVLGIFGASLLVADAMITPAISVLGAMEGLGAMKPQWGGLVLPASVGILVGLFAVQRFGTGRIGLVFGPVIVTWFLALGLVGLWRVIGTPSVLLALDPRYAVGLWAHHPGYAFTVLGSVFLTITGAEAMYADMGHFGIRAIRAGWFRVALPGLLFNYYGQAAVLLHDPAAAPHLFYETAPMWLRPAMLVLATMATIIASQAVISGTFSLASQAVQFDLTPRLVVRRTSPTAYGQVYVPAINLLLMVGTIYLMLEFKSSSNLAAAYGIAVSINMLFTTVLLAAATRFIWRWPLWQIALLLPPLIVIDGLFAGSNLLKVGSGGWIPLLIAIAGTVVMMTWSRGRALIRARMEQDIPDLEVFLKDVRGLDTARIPGTAVYFTEDPARAPRAWLHNFIHNRAVHQTVILLTVRTSLDPYIDASRRVTCEDLGGRFFRVKIAYGFMEQPDVPHALAALPEDVRPEPIRTSYFLGRVQVSLRHGHTKQMAHWRRGLFAWLARNAMNTPDYFRLPPNRVVELGAQVPL